MPAQCVLHNAAMNCSPDIGLPETVSMTTRDGVRLDADLYRPAGSGPWPVLLMRQPYGRRIANTLCYAHPSWYAAHGYLVAIQDVRGRGSSEGVFRTWKARRRTVPPPLPGRPGCRGRTAGWACTGFRTRAPRNSWPPPRAMAMRCGQSRRR